MLDASSYRICITRSGCRCRGVGRVGVVQVNWTSASVYYILKLHLTLTMHRDFFYRKNNLDVWIRCLAICSRRKWFFSSFKINPKENLRLVSSSLYLPLFFILSIWCGWIGHIHHIITCCLSVHLFTVVRCNNLIFWNFFHENWKWKHISKFYYIERWSSCNF